MEDDLPTDVSETTTTPGAVNSAGSGGSALSSSAATAEVGGASTCVTAADAVEDNGDEAARATAAELFGSSTSSSGDKGGVANASCGDDNDDELDDPLLAQPPTKVRDGDYVLLHFADGKQVFAHCVSSWRGKSPPVKIAKRSYPTANLIGLPYGTVLELGRGGLIPLEDGEDVMPDIATNALGMSRRSSGTCSPLPPPGVGGAPQPNVHYAGSTDEHSEENDPDAETEMDGAVVRVGPGVMAMDNRDLVDTNTAQGLSYSNVEDLRDSGVHGSEIVAALIENSATFDGKTEFSKAKYIKRKQMKYQPRCRMVRCTGATICEAWFLKEPRKIMNMREDTLAQILAYSNVCAGCQVMVYESTQGIITGALAQRMGGYGKIISLYIGGQPAFAEMIARFNLTFGENHSIKWLHTGEIMAEDASVPVAPSNGTTDPSEEPVDYELAEREQLVWPCPLQPHTRTYLDNMSSDRDRADFLSKRCARFARKLTRHTVLETRKFVHDPDRLCSSIILATKYDPTACLLKMLPHLAPSCPFVVYCEFIEPLAECFREVQRQGLAINLRLTDTWYREYQVLPGRTHPNMTMSQSGGFLLTGVKLCPVTGTNELDDSVIKALKAQEKGRRGKQRQRSKAAKKKRQGGKNESKGAKRARIEAKARIDGKKKR